MVKVQQFNSVEQPWKKVDGKLLLHTGVARLWRKTTKAINAKLGRHTLYTVWQNLGMHWPWGQKVNGKGHMVIKCTASMGMHVSMAAYVFSWLKVQRNRDTA